MLILISKKIMSDIEVTFKQKGEKNITIKINPNNKFSELIDKYYRAKCKNLKFMFMKNEIMPSSETSLEDLGIKNLSKIQVELDENIEDSFSRLEEIKQNIINKNIDKSLYNFLPKDYKSKSEQIKKEISKKYIIDTNKEASPENTIEMIKDINTFSTIIKEEIIKKKKENPETIVPISEAVDSSKQTSLFALGILGAFLQNNGTEVMIEKENNSKNNEEKDQCLQTCIMFATSEVGLSKKYELKFDLDETKSKLLLENEEEAEKYLNSWRKILSKQMSVPEETILFFNPRKGSYIIDVKFIQQPAVDIYPELENLKKTHIELRDVREKVIIQGCILSPGLLDSRYNKELGTWNRSNTNRGNELYDPPHGWLGFGLNVLNKYNDTKWIGKQNNPGEWIVVYHGIARNQTNVVKLVLDANNPNDSHLKPGLAQAHEFAIDKRHKNLGNGKCNKCDRIFSCVDCHFQFSFDKCSDEEKSCNCHPPKKFKCHQCLDGVYCTPQMSDFLSYANQFEIKGDNNVKHIYRIGFMYPADPMKIRPSQN